MSAVEINIFEALGEKVQETVKPDDALLKSYRSELAKAEANGSQADVNYYKSEISKLEKATPEKSSNVLLNAYRSELAKAEANGSQSDINYYKSEISKLENAKTEAVNESAGASKDVAFGSTPGSKVVLHSELKGDYILDEGKDMYGKKVSFGSGYDQRNKAASEYNKNGESLKYKSEIKKVELPGVSQTIKGRTESSLLNEAKKTEDPIKKKELLGDAAKAKANHDIWMNNTYGKKDK